MSDEAEHEPIERRGISMAVLEWRVRQLEIGQDTILHKIETFGQDVTRRFDDVAKRFDRLDEHTSDSFATLPSWIAAAVAVITLAALFTRGAH